MICLLHVAGHSAPPGPDSFHLIGMYELRAKSESCLPERRDS